MLPRWFERLTVLLLLLIGAYFRLADLPRLPLGFSDSELAQIDISQQILDGTVRVFFDLNSPVQGGQESLWHGLNSLGTRYLWGDGLLGYRMLNVWIGLLSLALLFRLARVLMGRGIALVTLGIMTTAISPILVSRSAQPEALAMLLALSVLGLLSWIYRLHEPIAPRPPRTLPYTLLGFTVGLGLYIHYIGVLLALIVLLFMAYLWLTKQPLSRQIWPSNFFTINLILILALPYMISVIRNPEQTSWAGLWARRPASLVDWLEGVVRTLGAIGLRGDADPTHNVPGLPLMSPFWFVMACVGVYFALRRWREPAYGLLLIFLGVGALPALWVEGGADFSTLLLAQPILFMMAGLGTFYAASYLHQSQIIGGWPLVALIASLVYLWTGTQAIDGFLLQWTKREDVRLAYHSHLGQLTAYLDSSPESTPTLLCVDSLESSSPSGLSPYGEMQIAEWMLSHEDLPRRYAICRSGMVFVQGGDVMRVLLSNPRTLSEAAPDLQPWLALLEPFSIAEVEAGLAYRLDSSQELAQLGGQLQTNSPLLYPAEGSPSELVSLPLRFGRNITLLGYLPLPLQSYQAGDALTLTTYWRVDGPAPDHLGVFLRLHDTPQASPYTETNVLDVAPTYLQTRDVVLQVSYMTIPSTLLPGDYRLTVGLYDNNPLNQIAIFEPERGTYLVLGGLIRVTR
jgi:4-amino-4-deoxy-L-arabinose transferase-like glycosyltransferase